MQSSMVCILLIVISSYNCQSVVHEEGVPGGPLLFRGDTGSVSEWKWEGQQKTVRIPDSEDFDEPIGYLKISNELDSDFSTAAVKDGGVGSVYVKITYYAPAFRGYHYNVEIRGEPNQ